MFVFGLVDVECWTLISLNPFSIFWEVLRAKVNQENIIKLRLRRQGFEEWRSNVQGSSRQTIWHDQKKKWTPPTNSLTSTWDTSYPDCWLIPHISQLMTSFPNIQFYQQSRQVVILVIVIVRVRGQQRKKSSINAGTRNTNESINLIMASNIVFGWLDRWSHDDELLQQTFGILWRTFGFLQETFGVLQRTFGVLWGTFDAFHGTSEVF